VDYESMIYVNRTPANLTFEPRGRVYGVIRLNFIPGNPVYELLVKRIIEKGFIDDKKVLFMVRDPRDILVSRYYSMGFTHGFSPNPVIRRIQCRLREEIQKQTLDEYVVDAADDMRRRMETVYELNTNCRQGAILKYEDMIDNFDLFMGQASEFLELSREVKRQIYIRSRPKEHEDTSSHRRSGKVAGFRSKLAPDTIARLNEFLKPTLERFGYPL
jgi:hypothetical protein